MTEAKVQADIRIAAGHHSCRLWRNNSGACYDQSGRLIRYGLGNDSAQMNKRIKSPDLVGWTTVTVTPEMVGQQVAIFTGVECKAPGWNSGKKFTEREQAQLEFIGLVCNDGGYAGFAASVDHFKRIIEQED